MQKLATVFHELGKLNASTNLFASCRWEVPFKNIKNIALISIYAYVYWYEHETK